MSEDNILEKHVYDSYKAYSRMNSFTLESRINMGKDCVLSDFTQGHKGKLLEIADDIHFPEEVRIYALKKFLELPEINEKEAEKAKKKLNKIEHSDLKLQQPQPGVPQNVVLKKNKSKY